MVLILTNFSKTIKTNKKKEYFYDVGLQKGFL